MFKKIILIGLVALANLAYADLNTIGYLNNQTFANITVYKGKNSQVVPPLSKVSLDYKKLDKILVKYNESVLVEITNSHRALTAFGEDYLGLYVKSGLFTPKSNTKCYFILDNIHQDHYVLTNIVVYINQFYFDTIVSIDADATADYDGESIFNQLCKFIVPN